MRKRILYALPALLALFLMSCSQERGKDVPPESLEETGKIIPQENPARK